MLLNVTNASQIITDEEFSMLDQSYWGHPVSKARQKTASDVVRRLLFEFDHTPRGNYSDDERRNQRDLILEGFFAVFAYPFRDSFLERISEEDPGPTQKPSPQRINTVYF